MNSILDGMIKGDITPEDAIAIVTGVTIAAIKSKDKKSK